MTAAAVAELPARKRARPLDIHDYAMALRRLTAARLELQQLWLHVRGDAHAEQLLREAGLSLKATFDEFEAGYRRGGRWL